MPGALVQGVRYFCAVLLMVLLLGAALLVAPFSRHRAWWLVRLWCRQVLAIFRVRVQVHSEGGGDPLAHGGIIVGLTQQSLLDPTIGYASWQRPVRGIWNLEYALIPLLGWVTVFLGWVIVRQRPRQAKRQLAKAADFARQGGLVYLSAEGRRSADGGLSPYKKGPVVMAIAAQVPMIPVYIAGSRACLAPGQWRVRPGAVVIHYLPPIATEGLTYADRHQLLAQLREVGEQAHRRWRPGAADDGGV
ncbi:MAG: lysophospholipid acyltransferase family protein [Alcanivorax sp.]|nr:lysophospholipid acyltransferase family protein [Alcanivorax sp.]